MDYAEDSCALRRAFGAEGQEVVIELRQFQPGDGMMFTAYGEPLRTRMRPALFRFEPVGEEQSRENAQLLEVEGFGRGITLDISLHPVADGEAEAEPETVAVRETREAAMTGISISGILREETVFQTGSMAAPVGALRNCMDELLTHWGIDVEAHRSLQRQVEPKDYDGWVHTIVNTGFPRSMIRRGENAIVRVRLIVGTDGRAVSCHIPIAIGHPDFEEAACRTLMDHAKFDPALDANGDPIESYWVTSIAYRTS
ncbi:energy transducer TonB [Alteraurantiacibacter aquimixticola]|nr:energy transducer TonB [Alteraurantiacibacter aquimixticola]